MSLAAAWIELEVIVLSEMSQKKANAIGYYFCVESKKQNRNKLIDTEYFDSYQMGEELRKWLKMVKGLRSTSP